MTLGGRKRHLTVVIDTMLSDAYPSEAMQLGQWLVEMGHMIVLSETSASVNQPVTTQPESIDFSRIERDIPPDQLN